MTESRSLSIFQYRAAKTILFNKMEICLPPLPPPPSGPRPLAGAFEYLPRLNSYNEAPFKSQNLFGQVDKKSMPTRAFLFHGNDENSPPSNDQRPPTNQPSPSVSKRSTKKLKCKSRENAKILLSMRISKCIITILHNYPSNVAISFPK